VIIVVPVAKKEFKGSNPWVMISNFHIKIDGCVGQSFIRSYAVLTRETDQSDVVLSYVGLTKAVWWLPGRLITDHGRPGLTP
jgi:MspA protein